MEIILNGQEEKQNNRSSSLLIEKCLELNIDYINQYKNGQKGNYYKFIILSEKGDISAEMPHLQTTTSKVYDYCLGNTKAITTNHACLPIWYGQSPDVAEKVIKELEESVNENSTIMLETESHTNGI